jgi:outer membrane receptor protein involved in Fe transport
MILTGDFLVQLNHKINDFNGKLILGNSMYANKYRRVNVANNSLVIPELYNISNRLGEAGVGESMQNRNSIGVFADLTVGYKDFVFVHASARNDWDSRLTKENRSFFYPGVDASLVLSEAIPSLKDNSILTFAKVRGGWSKTGQISLDNWYATLPSFNPGLGNNGNTGFPYGSLGGFQLATTLSNPLLKPELTQEIEFGVELSFIRNRFHVEANYYKSNTKDQTIPASISYATGYASAYINAGELETSGIETQFKLTPLISLGEFDWNLVVNYTYQTSEVISIMPGLDQLLIADVSYAVVGQQFPTLLVTDVKRDTEGHIIVDATTGYPIKDPAIKNMGHGTPNNILGITNSMSFKGLNLNIVAEYRGGNMIANNVGNSLDFTGTSWHSAQNGRQNFVVPNSVINTGTADAPNYVPNTNVITRNAGRSLWTNSDYVAVQSTYLTSAAFWKLRELSLSYNVPVKNILGGAIRDAEIGIVGRNLIMLRPKTNMWTDPEFNSRSGNSNAMGYTTVDQTPPTRIYGFSVKLTF